MLTSRLQLLDQPSAFAAIWCQERGICDRAIHEVFYFTWCDLLWIKSSFCSIGPTTRCWRQIDFSTSLLAPPHLSVFDCCCVIPSLCMSGSVSCASPNLHDCWPHSFWGWRAARVWAFEVMILQVSDSPSQVTVVVGSVWWIQDWSRQETKGKLT